MICGALQTLNEDAFEDVASSERPSPSGLPTGEMIAAAAQLHLAPIRESSEFGSPSDEQKFNNNLLPYVENNNNNNNNNNSNNYNNTPTQLHNQQQFNRQSSTTSDYNRSASSHSLHSLGGNVFMGNGVNSLITNTVNTASGGSTGTGGASTGGLGVGGSGNMNLFMSSSNLRHSIGDGAHLLSASNIMTGNGVRGLPQRHHSVGDDLLCEPLTPQIRSNSNPNTGIPTVVVIPNPNVDQAATTHHIVDDTKL